ncbi:MAG: response regulator [Planctomycetota bacterium]
MFGSASGGGSSFQGAQRAPWRVLLADDDAGVRNSLAALLHLDGFATEEVGGGEEALRRLRSCSPSLAERGLNGAFDLMVLDVHMPDLTGVEVLKRARRELDWALPTLFVSGEASTDLHEEVKSAGGFRLLSKPVMPEDFRGSVRELVSTFLLKDEN